MTTLIVSDSKAMEAEAIRQKGSAQSALEAFVKDTNISIKARSKDAANKSVSTDHYLVQSQTELAFVMTNLDEVSAYSARCLLSELPRRVIGDEFEHQVR